MIIGQFTSKLTDKERLSVPKKFRNELGDNLVIARWYENCLVLVSKSGWEALLTRLGGTKDKVILPVRDLDRFVLGLAFELELDKQGRFIIPEILKSYAQIKDDVVFVGLLDRVEIWSNDNWNKYEDSIRERAEIAIEKLAKK
jgi:MraZ protein